MGDKFAGSLQRRECVCGCALGWGVEWHQEFTLQGLRARSVLGSGELSKDCGVVVVERWGMVVAIPSEF